MICRLCLNALDEQSAVLLFGGSVGSSAAAGGAAGAGASASAPPEDEDDGGKALPESSYLVQLISIHLYLCLSRDDAISTCICTECCSQLESFHNFWKLVELKQTTLCSQFLAIDCDVNWSEEGSELLDAPAEAQPLVPAAAAEVEPKVVTPTTANKFPCMFCEKSFKMRRYLEEHIATHTGDRPIACPYCEMAFRCRSNMYTHVKSKHTTQWLKAREERDAAKSGQNHTATEEAPATPAAAPPPLLSPPTPQPPPQQLPLSVIHSQPSEAAINLTIAKTPPSAGSRSSRNRASRRKTHSPKKVQHTEGSDASDEDSPQKRLKENELMLANYNAVAAAVVAAASLSTGGSNPPAGGQPADSLQQRLCASLLQQQQQDQLFAVMSATAAAAAATVGGTSSGAPASATTTTMLVHPYGNLPAEASSVIHAAPVSQVICPNCGELPGQNHRCLSKPKYACDVCGKCFKMKRYLEEHFATHTGVKLHTCAFCPTEFRSKSNMYHHTKRKHKAEWERSRATRSAAKASSQGGVQDVQEVQHVQHASPSPQPQAQPGPAAAAL